MLTSYMSQEFLIKSSRKAAALNRIHITSQANVFADFQSIAFQILKQTANGVYAAWYYKHDVV